MNGERYRVVEDEEEDEEDGGKEGGAEEEFGGGGEELGAGKAAKVGVVAFEFIGFARVGGRGHEWRRWRRSG
ncbi:hypothetical protein M5K25_007965 [Dendrobium thyrsiflorum]|uniref:Uncharacterized protein n=1 Tax=Dendrobium thyrsiflorum TaxID=117978 RepID=A0ABD0VEA1_DENTH